MIEPGRAFALNSLGIDGVQVRERVPAIIQDCHERMADAQEAAAMSHTGPYGYVWRRVLIEFARELGELPTAKIIPVPGAGYTLVSFNDTVLFPWRYARDAAVDISSRRFAVSEARDTLFTLQPNRTDVRLDIREEHPELTLEEQATADGLEQALARYAKVIVVGYSCSPAGLHDVQWGEALLGADGFLTMSHTESLLGSAARTLSSTGRESDGFAEGAVPAPILGLQDASEG